MNEVATVFVVDDEEPIRKGLKLSLRERGFVVKTFESAESFLDRSDIGGAAGCILLDVRMPKMSGIELQDELIRRHITTPIIFLSGHGDIQTAVSAVQKGAFDFLEKPYEIKTLVALIEQAIARDQQNREAESRNARIIESFGRLTAREREVMAMIVAGAANTPNRVVAEKLGISPRTVETYRARLMEKMHARSLSDLVEFAKVCEIYEPQDPK